MTSRVTWYALRQRITRPQAQRRLALLGRRRQQKRVHEEAVEKARRDDEA